MKKITFLAFSVAFCFAAHAQWNESGNNYTIGNLGIGIQTAVSKLHVAVNEDDLSWPVVLNNQRNSSTLSGYGVGLKLKHSWNHENKWSGIASIQESTWANESGLALYANESEKVRIRANGDVGIGLTAPLGKLHISGGSSNTLIWPLIVNNTLNAQSMTHYGVGIKLKHSHNGELGKWSGIASIQESSWANASGLALYADESEKVRIRSNGNVGIGVTNPTQKLQVAGMVYSTEVKVEVAAGTGPDYVFEPDYELRSLPETQAYITEKKHLPEIPSAREMEAEGIDLGEMNLLLLKKIEELTLHLIDQHTDINEMKELLQQQQTEIERLKNQ